MKTNHELESMLDAGLIAHVQGGPPVACDWDFGAPWAIYAPRFQEMAAAAGMIDIRSASARSSFERQRSSDYRKTAEGIAVFDLQGPLTKYPNLFSGTSAMMLRMQVRAARRDPSIAGAMLVVDSPGGQLRGFFELCNDLRAFAAAKPLVAFADDECCSAAFAVASQASKRFANSQTALIGQLGTFGVLVDSSGRAEQLGLKVHIVKAGEFKGAGTPGTPITEAHLAESLRLITGLNDAMLAEIARGLRKPVESIRALADGKVHLASDAVKLGLIDGVQSYEKTYSQLVAMTDRSGLKQSGNVNPLALAVQPEPVQQLHREPTAGDLASQFRSSVESLVAKGLDRQRAIREAARQCPEGHAAFTGAGTQTRAATAEAAQAIGAWGDVVRQTMSDDGIDRRQAEAIAAKKHPKIYQAMLRASGDRSRHPRLASLSK